MTGACDQLFFKPRDPNVEILAEQDEFFHFGRQSAADKRIAMLHGAELELVLEPR